MKTYGKELKDTDRPLVKKGKEEVIKLFNKRVSLYEKVLNKIDMSKTTINEASEIVIESTWLKDAESRVTYLDNIDGLNSYLRQKL